MHSDWQEYSAKYFAAKNQCGHGVSQRTLGWLKLGRANWVDIFVETLPDASTTYK